MTLDIVKAAERAHVVPQCNCPPVEIGGAPAPDCPIHGTHFSDADVDDEPTE